MELNALLNIIINALEDVKGQEIRVYNTTGKTSAFERVVIASGTSNRQTRVVCCTRLPRRKGSRRQRQRYRRNRLGRVGARRLRLDRRTLHAARNPSVLQPRRALGAQGR